MSNLEYAKELSNKIADNQAKLNELQDQEQELLWTLGMVLQEIKTTEPGRITSFDANY